MSRLPAPRGEVSPSTYALIAPALLLSQHLVVELAFAASAQPLQHDNQFWLLPLRRLAELPGLTPWAAAVAFAFSLAIAWALALLSFRRAFRSGGGYALAALSVVPAIQIGAVALLAVLPIRQASDQTEMKRGIDVLHVLQGVLAGMAIIVVAVLISALTFGAYGWGLFVMTPFTVGLTTAYLANRRVALEPGKTLLLVMLSASLGSVALVMLALEGIICLLMAAPLGLAAAALGGIIGHALASAGHKRGKPLLSVALLPAMFLLEAAMPPAVSIAVEQKIDIAASPSEVWEALTSREPISSNPGFVAFAGLAYPIRGELAGEGVDAERLGVFSTGNSRERITEWIPGRRLSFTVLSQPPAMEEMSPYRRVHSPHVSGYFETSGTSFDLVPLPGGGTRLTVRAAHILRIDPVLYWEPIARWAIAQNVGRVLNDLKEKAERRDASPGRILD